MSTIIFRDDYLIKDIPQTAIDAAKELIKDYTKLINTNICNSFNVYKLGVGFRASYKLCNASKNPNGSVNCKNCIHYAKAGYAEITYCVDSVTYLPDAMFRYEIYNLRYRLEITNKVGKPLIEARVKYLQALVDKVESVKNK